jgi:phosphinothricin acetyltransferase
MEIRDAGREDIEGITAIYNDAVEHTTAIWNETTVDTVNRLAWLADRQRAGYPVLVAVDDDGTVFGYASFGDWRAFDGYRHTVEHSVYVRAGQRGRGIGKALMLALIERARAIGKHAMVAGIEAKNAASIRLHEKLGFERVGYLKEVGTKFGTWLDLAFLQLTLDRRRDPDSAGISGRRVMRRAPARKSSHGSTKQPVAR